MRSRKDSPSLQLVGQDPVLSLCNFSRILIFSSMLFLYVSVILLCIAILLRLWENIVSIWLILLFVDCSIFVVVSLMKFSICTISEVTFPTADGMHADI